MKNLFGGLVVLFAFLLTSCMDSVDEVEKQNNNETQIRNYMLTNSLSPTKDTIGAYMILKQQNIYGKKATAGNVVTLNLELYTIEGKLISKNETNKPQSYIFGLGSSVIPGLELAVNWLREGEKATMLLPYYWAFGSQGTNDGVPKYGAVRLEVDIVSIQTEEDQIAKYITEKNFTNVETKTGGLRIVKTEEKTGDLVGIGKNAVVKYTGYLLDGTKFDSGNLTFKTGVGNNNMITGFDLGVQSLREGEKATLIIPSALAYGTNGSYSNGTWIIPPYAPIAFEVEIIAAQ